ncbi:MAG: glycosyltransferase family 9 protein [bacterium]|nr:glycosyltransferase family 9 protein [bacterium]
MNFRPECIHFKGHIPCTPHKQRGVHCDGCAEFKEREGRILLIKLGAAGDVIRTTPLLEPISKEYPNHSLTWITEFPDLVPRSVSDRLGMTPENLLWLRQTHFDLVINLDKDRQACALAAEVESDKLIGFTLGADGLCRPVTSGVSKKMAAAVENKFLTGLFDDVNQACTLTYPQEIFDICGYEYQGQEYVVDRPVQSPDFDLPAEGTIIGLNTGAGGRWTSRLWPENYWENLARNLKKEGYEVLLLGGPQEDEKNKRLAHEAQVHYLGHFDLPTFIGLMDRCELVVTAVTMAMHIALGLGKKLVLFNNIFNPHEFELYGRGVLMQPQQKCTCFFQPTCTNENFCMDTLKPDEVQAAVKKLLEKK